MLTQYIHKLYQMVDNLSLRERVIVAVAVVFSTYMLWSHIVFDWQNSLISGKLNSMELKEKTVSSLKDEISRIREAIKDPAHHSLRKQYIALQEQIAKTNHRMQNYKQQVIAKEQVYQVINEVLKDIQNVTLVSFASVDESDTETDTTKEEPAKATLSPMDVNMKRYKLVVRGDYFAVTHYLDKLEQQGWQFYWQELEYRVNKYPFATVTVYFHTLVK